MLAGALAAGSAGAASSVVTVTAQVPSTTYLSTDPADTAPAGNCISGVAGRTSFGTVLPNTSTVTSADCSVVFGSTNDTSMLRIAQADGRGLGMWQPSRGALDTGFNTTGKITTPIAAGASYDSSSAVVTLPTGETVVAGRCDMGATGRDFCLARYTTGGVLDTSWNATGKVTTAMAPGGGEDIAQTLLLQPDGKLVVVGYCDVGGPNWDGCIARYTAAGALDLTFNTTGKAILEFATGGYND